MLFKKKQPHPILVLAPIVAPILVPTILRKVESVAATWRRGRELEIEEKRREEEEKLREIVRELVNELQNDKK